MRGEEVRAIRQEQLELVNYCLGDSMAKMRPEERRKPWEEEVPSANRTPARGWRIRPWYGSVAAGRGPRGPNTFGTAAYSSITVQCTDRPLVW